MRYVIASFLILLVSFTGVFRPVRSFGQFLTGPVSLALNRSAVGLKESVGFFRNLGSLRSENLELLEERAALYATISSLEKAAVENVSLKEQLELKVTGELDRELVLANVLGNPTDTSQSTIVLDKGAKHGIKEGDNVVRGNHLVGIVTTITNGRSVVTLLTSPEVSATAEDINSVNKTKGLIKGDFGTSILMTRILPNEEISIGDTVVTTGQDGKFFPDLVVGVVEDVAKDPAQPLKTARIGTIIDINKLRQVFVIIER